VTGKAAVPPERPDRSADLSFATRALVRSLRRVRTEQALAVDGLDVAPVHDLRVALRRCRSLAEGFSDLNPHPKWRHLRKACKGLLQGLADLRDTQVTEEWVRRLGLDKGPAGAALMDSLDAERRHARRSARRTLKYFSAKRWKRWSRSLPERAERISASEAHFSRLALRRLSQARERERHWRQSRSRQAAHHLRVALKRFRYLVESFLPDQKTAWSVDLRRLQGFLGDIHDLDVLRQRVLPMLRGKEAGDETRSRWLGKIERARNHAVESYWKAVVLKSGSRRPDAGSRTLWDRWEKKLRQLAGVTFPISEGPSRSAARQAPPAARKSSPHPGRPRRLSAAR
jgi:CHAD domain-containing protein